MEILSLGEKIKQKRKELDMTLKDLAGDRITPGQISLVESGRSNPSMDLLEYLADRLNITVEYLMESAESQAEKKCIYFENIAESCILGQEYKKAEIYIEDAIYYSNKYKLEYRKAKNLYLKANIAEKLGDLVLAQKLYLDCNTIFINKKNYEEVVKSFLKLGNISINLKSLYSANSYLKQAEKVYLENKLSNELLLGEIYFKMAECYYGIEQIEKSMQYSFLATEKFNNVYNKKEYAKNLLEKAEKYNKSGNLNNAIYYSKIALKKYKELSLETNIAQIENRLGELFSEFKKPEEAFRHYTISKSLRLRNRENRVLETLLNICENYIKSKDLHSCENILIEASSYLEGADVNDLIKYKLLLYRVYIIKELFIEAEGTLIEAFKIAEENELNKKAAEIAMLIGKFYIDFKRDMEAAKYLDKGIDKLKELGVLSN